MSISLELQLSNCLKSSQLKPKKDELLHYSLTNCKKLTLILKMSRSYQELVVNLYLDLM